MTRTGRRPEHLRNDLNADTLARLRREWLADRLANLREDVSDEDRLLAASILREDLPTRGPKLHAKPGADAKDAASECEQYAVYLWDALRQETKQFGRMRLNGAQRDEAADYVKKVAASSYPEVGRSLTRRRIFALVDRPRPQPDAKLQSHFSDLAKANGFGFVGTVDGRAVRTKLRVKPQV